MVAKKKRSAGPVAVETRSWNGPSFSLGDPALAAYLGLGGRTDAGVAVNETSAMALSAVWRCVSLIAGAIAQLPLKSYRRGTDDERSRVVSFLDDPGGPRLSPCEFKELVMVHLLLHGNAYLLHEFNQAGAISALWPLHPSLVSVEPDLDVGKTFRVDVPGRPQKILMPFELTHIMGMTLDGVRGLSPLETQRQAIGTGLAGDKSAARHFSSGMLLSGVVSSDETLTEKQAEAIKAGLKAKLAGTDNAGDIAVVNASLKFSPWAMSAVDAQFLESRHYQVEEIARVYGVPPHLLAQTEKQTSWGTGVEEQNRGLARFTLKPWTTRIEERLSRLLPSPRFCEFDFTGFLEPAPEQEIPLLIDQVAAGLLTVDEARKIRNMPPLPPGAHPVALAPQTPVPPPVPGR